MEGKAYTNISFVYDRERSGFTYMDDAFAALLNKQPEEITPDLLLSLVHRDDTDYVDEKFQELLIGSLSGSVEFRIVIEGETHWIRTTPFLVNLEGKSLVAANVTDFTSEWSNSESIRRYANKKNSILNMLAHDLRGPLEIAHTLTRNINKKIDDPGLLTLTTSLSGIINQSIQLIASLIDRELLETVEVELSTKRIDIAMKIAEYVEECKRSESAADRIFNFSSSSKSIYLDLDEAKFMQIMNNLVTNSLKFTHPGGIISIEVIDKEKSVLFTVADNGIGIPKHFHDGLFDKFTKARRKGLNGEPTIGLGLSIAKMIVEWHKGKIWFESEEDAGTKFYFEIPKGGGGR
jgi:two-component system sensor histidine kinase VicK